MTNGFGCKSPAGKWLVHYFRDRDPERDFPHMTVATVGEREFARPADRFEVMKTSIRLAGLLPDCPYDVPWLNFEGVRNAVSACECDLAALLHGTEDERSQTGVTKYGIAFLADEFESAGGLKATDRENIGLRYGADAGWYWRPTSEYHDIMWCHNADGSNGAAGLPVFDRGRSPRYFSSVRLIVPSRFEAAEIQKLLTIYYLAGSNHHGVEFDRALIAASRIVVLDDLGCIEARRLMEDLSDAELLPCVLVLDPPIDASERIDQAYALSSQAAGKIQPGGPLTANYEDGEAFLTCADIMNPITQYLISSGNAVPTGYASVEVQHPHQWPAWFSLDYAERVCNVVADVLRREMEIEIEVNVKRYAM